LLGHLREELDFPLALARDLTEIVFVIKPYSILPAPTWRKRELSCDFD